MTPNWYTVSYMKLIVGLGNPGKEYVGTRHNVGWAVVEKIGKEAGAEFKPDKKTNSEVAKTKLNGNIIVLAKPQTFVNKSGEAVKKLIISYKLKAISLVVVHDDLDIEFGNFKLSFGKNSGGHRGVESVIKALKTKNFWRLKIGTANKKLAAARAVNDDAKRKQTVADFVLSKFTPAEQTELKKVIKQAIRRLAI